MTDDLPEPYRTPAFVLVRAELPPPPISRTRPDTPTATPNSAPLVEPVDILPEPIVEPVEQPGFDLGASLMKVTVSFTLQK
jgi:hypothetical protein